MKLWVRLFLLAVIIAAVAFSIGLGTGKVRETMGGEKATPRWGKVLVVRSATTTEEELQDLTGYLRSLKVPYDVLEATYNPFSSETFWKDGDTLRYSILIFARTDRQTFEEIPAVAWDEIHKARNQGLRVVFSGLALTLDDPEYYSRVYVDRVLAWDIPKSFTFYETLFKVGNLMDVPVYQPIRDADILVEAHEPDGYVAWKYGNTYVSADNGIGIIKYYVIDKAVREALIPVVPNMFALDDDDISGQPKFANPPFSVADSKKLLRLLDRHDAYVTNAVESENLDMELAAHLLERQDRYINTLHETIVFAPDSQTEATYTKLMDKMIYLGLAPDYDNHGVYIPPVHQIKPMDLQVLNKYGVKYVAQDMEMESIHGVIAKAMYGDLWLIGRVFVNGLHYNDATKLGVLKEVRKNTGNSRLTWDQAMFIWLEQLNKTIWRKVPFYTHETNFAYEAPGLEILQNYLEYLELRLAEKTTFYNVGEYHRYRRYYSLNSLIEGDRVTVYINAKKPVNNLALYHGQFTQVSLDGDNISWQKHKKQKNIIAIPHLEEGDHTLVLRNEHKAQVGTYFMAIPADNASTTVFWVKSPEKDMEVSATKGAVSSLEKGEDGFYKGTFYAGDVSGWASIVVKDNQGRVIGSGKVYLAPPDLDLKINVPGEVWAEKVTVSGTLREEASISINGRNLVNNLGSFQAEIPLDRGINYLTVVAADQEGRTQTVIKEVVRH